MSAQRDDEPDLRDLFAIAALISILRNRDNTFHPKQDAEWAYQVADAMMIERNKP